MCSIRTSYLLGGSSQVLYGAGQADGTSRILARLGSGARLAELRGPIAQCCAGVKTRPILRPYPRSITDTSTTAIYNSVSALHTSSLLPQLASVCSVVFFGVVRRTPRPRHRASR